MSARTLWPLSLLVGLVGPAHAGRSLEEPAAIRAIAKRSSKADRDAAFRAQALTERCAGAALGSLELSGMICRLAVHGHQSAARAVKSPADVDARLRSAQDAWDAAETIAAYTPVTKRPGLPQRLFEGHQLACRTVVETYDALAAVPRSADAKLKARVDTALASFGRKDAETLHDAACRCTQKSLALGGAASAPVERLGALQGTLTGRSCFLDQDKVKTERKGPQTAFTGTAKALAAQNTKEAQLRAYAKTRDLDLGRCREKDIPFGAIKDKERLEKCVCGEVRRWRFPKERGRPELELLLPVDQERVGVRVKVQANGKVSSCGPLEGPLVR